ncbi:MAG: hypothetical protein DVB31_05605 [Verrucomicrobia bacterium]|nr:MAG: hypothetical protein DVB31_05605 [Verrucomicrobiota bacterium]
MSHPERMSIRPFSKALLAISCLAWGSVAAVVPTSGNPTNSADSQNAVKATVPGSTAVSAKETTPPDPTPDVAPPKTTTTHPFTAIPARNAFQIKPPAPPAPVEPETPKAPPTPPPNVFLTGFSSWKGVKKVYLQVTRPNSKTPDYLELKVGEQQFDIKVLEINDRQESVKILNGDQEVALNFRENGLKSNAGPTPGTQGIPNPINSGISTPRLAAQANPAGSAASSGPAYIGRGGMAQQPGGGNAPAGFQGGAATGIRGNDPASQELRSIPARRGATLSTTDDQIANQNLNLPVVSPNQPRIINGKTFPPPPPLPFDPNAVPGNGN